LEKWLWASDQDNVLQITFVVVLVHTIKLLDHGYIVHIVVCL